MTKKRTKFLETYGDLNNDEILLEVLFAQSLQIEKLERIRYNTSVLVWWLIAIPLIILLFFTLLGGLSLF